MSTLRTVPVDDYSHSVVSMACAELADGLVWTDGHSDGGPFKVRVEPQARGRGSSVEVATADEADALIVLLMGAREIAFGAPFDASTVTTRT